MSNFIAQSDHFLYIIHICSLGLQKNYSLANFYLFIILFTIFIYLLGLYAAHLI